MAYTKTYSDDHDFLFKYKVNGSTWSNVLHSVNLTGSRSGTRVPDWKQKIADGLNASSDFTSDRKEMLEMSPSTASLSAVAYSGSPPATLKESFEGFVVRPSNTLNHLSVVTVDAQAAALQRIYAKIRSEYQKLNSSAVVAEGLDVIRQFGAPMSAIIGLTNRRINRLELASRGLKGSTAFRKIEWAKIVAGTWLEYSFGLKPLISDSVKIAEALAHWQDEADYDFHSRARVVGRGTSNAVTQPTPSSSLLYSSGKLFYQGVDRTETTYKEQYVCGLGASHRADIGSNERLRQLLGFTPENWIPAIWEVVPWSWLIDYFTNVGQILQAGVTSTADVRWTCRTVSRETIRQYTTTIDSKGTRAQLNAYGWNGTGSGHAGNWTQRRVTVTRDADAVLGVPPLSLSIPVDFTKLANMAAVLLNRRNTTSALWLT
jgi:hypothetical protein